MTYSSTVLALSPKRYFRLGEASGTSALDSSTQATPGTYAPGSGGAWTGGTLGVSGANLGDTAATFNGTSGTVLVGQFPANGATAFAFVGWVYITGGGGYRTLYSKFDDNANRLEISLGDSGNYGSSLGLAISLGAFSAFTAQCFANGNTWYHVAVRFDAAQTDTAKLKVQVDGVDVALTYGGSFTGLTALPNISANAYIGTRGGSALFWDGRFDDVALFDTPVSAAQATAVYAARDTSIPALSISGTPVTTGTVGTAYAGFAVSGSGGTAPRTFSVSSGTLPAGLSLNSSTGAISGTPTTAAAYSGIVIRVTDSAGTPATADLASFTITIAAAGAVPVNTVLPAITGTAQEGQTLTGGDGTWSNTPTSYARQWKRAGTNISGATGSTYACVFADVGSVITFGVLASNATGPAASQAVSSATSAVIAASSSLPAITAASTSASGTAIDMTFASGVALNSSMIYVLQDGSPVACSSVAGSGTAWVAFFGNRWFRAGATLTIGNDTTQYAVTNTSPATLERIRFVGQRLWLFIHAGIQTFTDSQQGTGTESPNSFSPTGNVSTGMDSWIAGALAMGAEGIVWTVKHHPGFLHWPSASTSFGIASSSWWSGAGSPDLVKLFCDKCRAAGLRICLYFSVWDLHFESVTPGFNSSQYTTHTQTQLNELLTNYGSIDALWFDGFGWNGGGGVQYSMIAHSAVYDYCKARQPRCLVIINDHNHTVTDTDIAVWEVPIEGAPGGANRLTAQTCNSIYGGNWFWNTGLTPLMNASDIVSMQSTADVSFSNALLNAPPDRSWALPIETRRLLASAGALKFQRASQRVTSPVSRTITLTLRDRTGALQTNLTNLKVAVYDQHNPGVLDPPVYQATTATTNGSGVMTLTFASGLPAGGTAWLEITSSDGNPATAHKSFAGPVAVT